MTKGPTALLLVDHGSRRLEAHDQLLALGERLARRLEEEGTSDPIVEIAHMEIAEPSIQTALGACVAKGARHVVVIPCFLSRGRHVQEDIPELLRAALARHPGVTTELVVPLSEQEGFIDLLLQAARSGKKA